MDPGIIFSFYRGRCFFPLNKGFCDRFFQKMGMSKEMFQHVEGLRKVKSIGDSFINGDPQFDEVLFMDRSRFVHNVLFFDFADRDDDRVRAVVVQMMVTCSPAYGSQIGDKDGGEVLIISPEGFRDPSVGVHVSVCPCNQCKDGARESDEFVDDVVRGICVGSPGLMNFIVDLFGDVGEGQIIFPSENEDAFFGGVGEGIFDEKGYGYFFAVVILFADKEPVHQGAVVDGFEHGSDEGMEKGGGVFSVPCIFFADETQEVGDVDFFQGVDLGVGPSGKEIGHDNVDGVYGFYEVSVGTVAKRFLS